MPNTQNAEARTATKVARTSPRITKETRRGWYFDRMSDLGFTYDEANTLRLIEKTLGRWGELECGNSNDYASWAIERDDEHEATCTQCAHKWYGESALRENCPKCGDCAPLRREATGKPYMVRHIYAHGAGKDRTIKTPIADREKGALKRAWAILANHPDLWMYHQGDPRGACLYVGRMSDMPEEVRGPKAVDVISCHYTRGVACCVD